MERHCRQAMNWAACCCMAGYDSVRFTLALPLLEAEEEDDEDEEDDDDEEDEFENTVGDTGSRFDIASASPANGDSWPC